VGVPPPVDDAVNVTGVPSQILFDVAVMLTSAGVDSNTVIVTSFDVTVGGLAQPSDELMLTEILSPFTSDAVS
jgi:hypothetical protein